MMIIISTIRIIVGSIFFKLLCCCFFFFVFLLFLHSSETGLSASAAAAAIVGSPLGRSGPHFLALFLGLDPDLADTGDFRRGRLWVLESAAGSLLPGRRREHRRGLAAFEAAAVLETATERGRETDLGRVSGSPRAED